jgi:Flp pilus assembly protein TadG
MFGLAKFARKSWNAGVAAMEFALLAPFLFALFAGVADFSIAYHYQMQVASALAAGAQYAFSQGQNESGSTLTNDVTSFVNKISPVTLSSVTASYNNGLDASSCYCVSGSPPAYTGPATCGSACSDGSGSTAGKYVSITGSFSYTPLFVLDQAFFSGAFSQTVTARLQ